MFYNMLSELKELILTEMVNETENNPLLFALASMKRNIEICRDNKIQELIQDPKLITSMSLLYTELVKYDLKS